MNTEKFWGYIGGIIDGEGTVTSPYIRPSGSITIVNADKKLLEKILEFLIKNGVRSYVNKRKSKEKLYYKETFQLKINGWRNLKIIFNNCPILIEEKRNRLEFIIRRGETKEKLKQDRINDFIKIKIDHPEYSLRKIARILNENLSNILYRWGVKELLKKKITID